MPPASDTHPLTTVTMHHVTLLGTHGSNGDHFVKVVDVHVHKYTVKSRQELLAYRNKVLGERSACGCG